MMLCLFPYQRVFYALASWCPSQRTYDFSKRRGLVACAQNNDTNGKLLCPNHLRSLPAAPHSDLSARQYKGLFQDMMFERLQDSTFSEDASEVIVQPLPCGTEKANSVTRVVVKHTPRLCNRCASYNLVHSGGAGLRILGRILDHLLAKMILAPRWWSNQPNTQDWRYLLHAVSGVSHHSIQCFSHPSAQIFQ